LKHKIQLLVNIVPVLGVPPFLMIKIKQNYRFRKWAC